jgi:hypothetical protein
MTDITIPPVALEAGARALAADAKLNWDDIPQTHNIMRREARAAFLAMLEEWPGAEVHNFDGWTHAEGLVLPLTGASDD